MKSWSSAMRVGIIGTGAISWKHAEAYANIGYEIVACTNRTEESGRKFAAATGARFLPTAEEVCAHPDVDFVDVCTFPDFRLAAVRLCAQAKKHVLVQKPMAIGLEEARRMIDAAAEAGIQLGVVSQHRFDDSVVFLKGAIGAGRLGRIIEADAYVKWYRSPEYYRRAGKGTWAAEGGGALINQGIHQVDLLLYLAGAVAEVRGQWQLGALHEIESEDIVNGLLRFSSGATGVIQASTALWPGTPERIEIHGTNGSAILSGDQLVRWDVRNDHGEPAPVRASGASGSSDPMGVSVLPFERQLIDFGTACRTGRRPRSSGVDGYKALELVRGVYDSCVSGDRIRFSDGHRITPPLVER